MKSFLSILSVETNQFSKENIVVGLFVVTSNATFFAYSEKKVAMLDKAAGLKNNYSKFVSTILKQTSTNVEIQNTKTQISILNDTFSWAYFDYLKDYSGGALKFSEPVLINKTFDQNSFDVYFEKFVGDKISPKQKTEKKFKSKVTQYFKKAGLSEKVDIEFKFNPIKFNGILMETKIPLITKNGQISAIQVVDFKSSTQVIANHLYETQMIYEGLSNFSKAKDIAFKKVNIAFEEPALNTPQHNLFDMAYAEKSEFFNFIDATEVDNLTDEILNSNYSKFSNFID